MSEKTIGQLGFEMAQCPEHWPQIAKDIQWEQLKPDGKRYWQSAATAIWNKAVEECAAKLCRECREGHTPTWMPDIVHFDHVHPEYTIGCGASSILSLKKGNTNERG